MVPLWVLGSLALRGALGRQQGVLPHQAQDALGGDLVDPIAKRGHKTVSDCSRNWKPCP